MMMYKAKKANKFLWGSELVQLNSVNFHMEIPGWKTKQNETKLGSEPRDKLNRPSFSFLVHFV